MTEIGVFTPEEQTATACRQLCWEPCGMLQEAALQFDVIDSQSDFERYALLTCRTASPSIPAGEQIAAYLPAAARHCSLLNPASIPPEMALQWPISAQSCKPNRYAMQPANRAGRQYRLKITSTISNRGRQHRRSGRTEYALYTVGLRVTPLPNTTVLAVRSSPISPPLASFLFAPSDTLFGPISGAAIIAADHVVYFSHPMFEIYHQWAPRWCKALLLDGIDRLLANVWSATTGRPLCRFRSPNNRGLQCAPAALYPRTPLRNDRYHRRRDSLHDLEISLRVDRPCRV
jgi:hypothetical protein